MLATAQCEDVAFLICESTPGVDTDRQMAYAIRRGLKSRGCGPAEIDAVLRQRSRCMELLRLAALDGGKFYEFKEFVLDAVKGGIHHEFVVPRAWVEKGDIETILYSLVEAERSRPGYVYDPKPYLLQVRVPFLALFGGNDELVPVEESRAVISHALKAARNDRFDMETFAGADHNLRMPDGAIVSGYIELMLEWLRKNLRNTRV